MPPAKRQAVGWWLGEMGMVAVDVDSERIKGKGRVEWCIGGGEEEGNGG